MKRRIYRSWANYNGSGDGNCFADRTNDELERAGWSDEGILLYIEAHASIEKDLQDYNDENEIVRAE